MCDAHYRDDSMLTARIKRKQCQLRSLRTDRERC